MPSQKITEFIKQTAASYKQQIQPLVEEPTHGFSQTDADTWFKRLITNKTCLNTIASPSFHQFLAVTEKQSLRHILTNIQQKHTKYSHKDKIAMREGVVHIIHADDKAYLIIDNNPQ